MTKDEQNEIILIGKMRAVNVLMADILPSIHAAEYREVWRMITAAKTKMAQATSLYWDEMDQLIEE